jgi:hypothetical protein
MTAGDPTFGFFSSEGDVLTSVTYPHAGWLRWSGWSYDAESAVADLLLPRAGRTGGRSSEPAPKIAQRGRMIGCLQTQSPVPAAQ